MSRQTDKQRNIQKTPLDRLALGRITGVHEGLGSHQSPRIWSVALQRKPALDTQQGGSICTGNLPVWPCR